MKEFRETGDPGLEWFVWLIIGVGFSLLVGLVVIVFGGDT